MDLTQATVAVTGASGFLGRAIVESLHQSKTSTIRGVVRNPQKAAPILDPIGAETRVADLGDRDALRAAFEGADVVVSNAALFAMQKMSKKFWEENRSANVEGTENVLHAAAEAGVKRLILISTFGVYRWSIFRRLSEDSPQLNGERREGGAYRATKQLAEARAWELGSELGLEITSIRPSGIYGPHDPNFMKTVKSLSKAPIFPALGVTLPLVYVGDVADAVVSGIRNDETVGKAYNTCGGRGSPGRFLSEYKRVAGRFFPILIPLPLFVGVFVDSGAAERDLGFKNRSFEAGLRESFQRDRDLLR